MKKGKNLGSGTTDEQYTFQFKRRDFLKLMGSGIVVTFLAAEPFDLLAQDKRRSLPSDFNAFLRVDEEGKVSCFTGKIEMGQGIITSLAQMLADELDVNFDDVTMVMGDTDLCPWDMGTFGSMSTRFFGPALRAAAAEARTVLLSLASDHLGVAAENLKVSNGLVYDPSHKDHKVTYAELTRGKKIERHLTEKPDLKSYTEFIMMGKPELRRDALEKVTGEARYAGDIRIPGLKFARVLRPPSHGAMLKDADTSAAEKIEGIEIYREGDFIAALHDFPDMADIAIAKIKAEYDYDEMPVDDKTIFTHLLHVAGEGETVSEKGDLAEGSKHAAKIIESEYLNSYVAHAPMEPHSAVAHIEGDKITVWASTQTPFRAQEEIARLLDFPLEKVRVITPFVGGGFGGKSHNLQAHEAARLARMSGKPVLVMWDRKEEFFNDTFRPAAVVKVKSGISGQGMITMWDYAQYFAGSRGSDTIYDVPHQKTMSYMSGNGKVHPFGTGAWRAPGNNTNTFARESQIDIMASAAGMDPLDFRLKNLKDEKMIAVLKAVADKFGWKPAKAPSGRGYGIACGTDAGTYVAHMAEVSVDKKTGKIKVIRVACAQDMGLAVNPEGATIQMEGCITMGLGYALAEELMFTGGKIHDHNFDSYTIPHFSWLPQIETVILHHPDAAPQGGGEPAIIAMGGLIANGVFDATGVRLFQLPMTPARVLEALSK